MAGMKTWVPGEEVKAADLQGFVQTQVVPVFASGAQRDSQWPSPPRGALCFLLDGGYMMQRGATAWGGVYMNGLLAGTINAYPGLTITVNANELELRGQVAGNNYNDKGLQVWRLAGSAGLAGIGLSDDVVAQALSIQGFLTTDWGLHLVSWNNATHLPMYATQFKVAALRAEARAVTQLAVDALAIVDRLHPVSYEVTYDPRPNEDGTVPPAPPPVTRVGFLADDIADFLPDDTDRDADGATVAYDLGALVALLTKAVQELAARLADVEERCP